MPQQVVSNHAIDTFSLLLNYPDPFDISYFRTDSRSRSSGPVSRGKVWPRIIFYGTISSGNRKVLIASVQVNNKSKVVKQGDTCSGIKVILLTKEKIVVSYCGVEKSIKRETEK